MSAHPLSHLIRTAAVLALVLGLSSAYVPAWAQKRAPTPEPISLNFVNAEIDTVARALANLTGRNLVLDPRVKGTMTFSTEKPMPAELAWAQFLSALRLQGFAVVEVNGLYKVLPEGEAKLQGGSVVEPTEKTGSGGQIITQIFRLQHENANQLVGVLRPLISPNNTINVNQGSNSLVITDYTENLQRLARIIASLDTAQATDIEVIPLKHAVANDLAPLLQRLIDTSNAPQGAPPGPGNPGNPGGADAGYRTVVLPEPRSNSLILRAANPVRLMQARQLAEKLDRPGGTSESGNIHVVYLKNADATKLANTLRAALSAEGRGNLGQSAVGSSAAGTPLNLSGPNTTPTSGTTGGLGSTPAQNSNAVGGNTGGQIQADPATNSLIISAPEPVYRQLRAVIDQLDGRRAQVLVESLIAEVDANKASQFGVQWQNVMGNRGGNVGIIGTNFGSGGNNLLNLSLQGSSGKLAPNAGLNIGTGQRLDNGAYILGSLANFLQQSGGSNILSTPTLLTLDNEEAKIVVGQNVPFVTGQYTANNTNSGAVNPFQTIERRDVGLTLKVKPQISETGTVKLTIYQEVSSVVANSIGSTTGLITNKRSIESNVLVDDGQVVVLGGLLSDEYNNNTDQVPGLGNVPILGALFRSESRERKKTNLMVFLRPVVLRDAAAAESLSGDRYQNMIGQQRQGHVPASGPMTVDNNMTLPPLERKP
ncbi:MAG: type secretion system protein [Pseudomonadota bacterium]|jgi:general secretion pathway protein D